MKLTSTAFEQGKAIPSKYTCDGVDVSPPFQWIDPPPKTACFVLISDDPDAPMGTWVHWIIFNIPAEEKELKEGIPTMDKLPNGAIQGLNDSRSVGYSGPCPPSGTHRYFFKLYALDTRLSLSPKARKADVVKAMENHILTQAELMGTYRRR
ncbi:MAG: YbhB/YbcL family Raf kinase inhibitor-like protein [Elusimicrobia bacterium]|nr:YbhB/YbcL family Raf kinase inhibitor-like protein [Candidatus Obscuribacterium magneticum]